ncbi:hypothetical protein KKF91_21365 [Myxococcota bacterium]|nr:hypothetical protein [Myxococcota bacterium]MBU1433095.1 hypothetical protein [Myxococcota bacterium]MBU1897653.1 hypothetical protein [Myxococcota bacterium]
MTDLSTPKPPNFTFHPPRSVGIATFMGSPIAGGALMALNERRLERSAGARTFLFGAIKCSFLSLF